MVQIGAGYALQQQPQTHPDRLPQQPGNQAGRGQSQVPGRQIILIFPRQGPVLGGGGDLFGKKFSHQPGAVAVALQGKAEHRPGAPQALQGDAGPPVGPQVRQEHPGQRVVCGQAGHDDASPRSFRASRQQPKAPANWGWGGTRTSQAPPSCRKCTTARLRATPPTKASLGQA
jgi:hypothetical protein